MQASLELASALDPHEPAHRGSPSRRIPQEHLHFPQWGVPCLLHIIHVWSIFRSHPTAVPRLSCLLESSNGHPLAAYLDLAELMLVQQERSIFAQPRIDPSHAADKLITVILVREFVLWYSSRSSTMDCTSASSVNLLWGCDGRPCHAP